MSRIGAALENFPAQKQKKRFGSTYAKKIEAYAKKIEAYAKKIEAKKTTRSHPQNR